MQNPELYAFKPVAKVDLHHPRSIPSLPCNLLAASFSDDLIVAAVDTTIYHFKLSSHFFTNPPDIPTLSLTSPVHFITLSRDATLLAALSEDSTLSIVSLSAPLTLVTSTTLPFSASSLVWYGSTLFTIDKSSSADSIIPISFSTSSLTTLPPIPRSSQCTSLTLSPDSPLLAASREQEIIIIDIPSQMGKTFDVISIFNIDVNGVESLTWCKGNTPNQSNILAKSSSDDVSILTLSADTSELSKTTISDPFITSPFLSCISSLSLVVFSPLKDFPLGVITNLSSSPAIAEVDEEHEATLPLCEVVTSDVVEARGLVCGEYQWKGKDCFLVLLLSSCGVLTVYSLHQDGDLERGAGIEIEERRSEEEITVKEGPKFDTFHLGSSSSQPIKPTKPPLSPLAIHVQEGLESKLGKFMFDLKKQLKDSIGEFNADLLKQVNLVDVENVLPQRSRQLKSINQKVDKIQRELTSLDIRLLTLNKIKTGEVCYSGNITLRLQEAESLYQSVKKDLNLIGKFIEKQMISFDKAGVLKRMKKLKEKSIQLESYFDQLFSFVSSKTAQE
ncbi:hypothetical protein P9112_004372 [Eukaryota sp. TZLM1-RC]